MFTSEALVPGSTRNVATTSGPGDGMPVMVDVALGVGNTVGNTVGIGSTGTGNPGNSGGIVVPGGLPGVGNVCLGNGNGPGVTSAGFDGRIKPGTVGFNCSGGSAVLSGSEFTGDCGAASVVGLGSIIGPGTNDASAKGTSAVLSLKGITIRNRENASQATNSTVFTPSTTGPSP